MTGSELVRDTRENKRLSNVAFYFDELKKLRKLMSENRDSEEVLDLLYEARIQLISILEELGVDLLTAEAFFTFDGRLTPDFIETFRKTESRKFWE